MRSLLKVVATLALVYVGWQSYKAVEELDQQLMAALEGIEQG